MELFFSGRKVGRSIGHLTDRSATRETAQVMSYAHATWSPCHQNIAGQAVETKPIGQAVHKRSAGLAYQNNKYL